MAIKNETIKYVAYTRKSTEGEDRQSLSLNDQKRELDELTKREGLSVNQDHIGEKQSAHKRGRPIFAKVVELIESGKANGLLVWHPNRIARNAFDGGLIITLMDEGKLLEVKTPTKTYHNNSSDKFFLQMEFGMAKKSSDDNSEVVKRGLHTKLNMGWYPSYAPLGYLNTKNFEQKGQNTIYNDPDRFETIKRMWQMMLTGNYTPPQILKIINDDWKFKTRTTNKFIGKPLAKSSIYRIFTNPFYYGMFEYPKGSDFWFQGKHEPMITEKEFDIVQKLLGRDGRPRSQSHKFAFTGLMRCGNCGAMITAEEKFKHQKNGNTHYYIYYHCTKRKDEHCPERMVEVGELMGQINKVIDGLQISERFKNWALKYLHVIRQNEANNNEIIIENRHKELEYIIKQLDALLLKYISPENSNGEIISVEEYQNSKKGLLKRKNDLESQLNVQGKEIEDWLALSEKTFNYLRYATIHFNKGDIDTKKTIFACLGSHFELKDQKITVTLRKLFESMLKDLPVVESELEMVRTPEKPEEARDYRTILSSCPTLRWG